MPAIADWSKSNRWLRLEIIQANEKLDKTHAQVEFKVHYHDGWQAQAHHEVSHFVRQGGAWHFLDPTAMAADRHETALAFALQAKI